MPVQPKHILSVSSTEALKITRELLLRESGFLVASATGERDLAHLCRRGTYDLAIIGYVDDNDLKIQLAKTLRQHCPKVPILELCRVSPIIPEVDHVLVSPEPPELITKVRSILGNLPRERTNPA